MQNVDLYNASLPKPLMCWSQGNIMYLQQKCYNLTGDGHIDFKLGGNNYHVDQHVLHCLGQ